MTGTKISTMRHISLIYQYRLRVVMAVIVW